MSIPSTCETLDYIEMNGAFFDSGIAEDSRAIAVSCKFYTAAPANNYMYGTKQNGSNCVFNGVYSNDTFEVNYTEVSFTAANTIVMAQSVSGTTLSYNINGMTGTKTMSGSPSGYHILIGACYRNTGAERPYGAPLRVYYFRIVKDGATVRDLIPVRKADGTVCLWDDVTETFITPSGSGTVSGYPAPTNKKLKYNGTVPQNITYNGTPIKTVKYNGVTVWKKEFIVIGDDHEVEGTFQRIMGTYAAGGNVDISGGVTGIWMNVSGNYSFGDGVVNLYLDTPIDLTDYSKAKFTVWAVSGSSARVQVGFAKTLPTDGSVWAGPGWWHMGQNAQFIKLDAGFYPDWEPVAAGTYEADISALTGNHYLCTGVMRAGRTWEYTEWAVSSVILE